MTSRRAFIQTGALAIGATLSTPWVARAAAKRVRLAHASSEIHPAHKMTTSFKEHLEKLVPGAFNVQIFPNRQLGDDKQNVESVVAGSLDMCQASGILFPLVTGRPALDAWQLPFIVRDYDHFGELALGPIGQAMLDDLEPAGLVGLTTADIGRRHFLTVGDPVKSLTDFDGLKTRIVPVPLHKEIWEAIGTAPVGLPYGEVYGALETGVIDAVEINISSMLGENLWEVGKNFTLTGHYPWHAVTAMSKTFFDAQTPDLQAAIREAGRLSVTDTLDYAKTQDEEGRDELMKKGVDITELSDLDALRDKVAPIVGNWTEKNPLIADFVKAADA